MNSAPIAVLTTAATWEPLTLDELKKHLEIADGLTVHDLQLTKLIATAREIFEGDTGIVVASSTWTQKRDKWPATVIELERRPVRSVTITYLDVAGATQTWAAGNYELDLARARAAIWPAYGIQWPAIRDVQNAISIAYVAGYASAAAVPSAIKAAILLKASWLFVDREGGSTKEFESAYNSLAMRFQRSSYP